MKKKVISCLLVACLLSGCGSNNVNTIVEEESEAAVEETEAMVETENEEKSQNSLTMLSHGAVMDWYNSNKTEIGIYVYAYMQNNTDEVLENVRYQCTVLRESDATVLATTDLFRSYIAPHETAILAGSISMSMDDANDIGESTLKCLNIDSVNASKAKIVPQSEIVVDAISANMGPVDMVFLGQVTNNGKYTISNGDITLVAKKDGEPQAIVQGQLYADIKSGDTYTFELHGTANMTGDYDEYDVYVDCIQW